MKLSLDSMSQRERRLVMVSGAVAALVLIFGILLPLDRSVAKARDRVTQKQADLVWMRGVAPTLAALGPMQTANNDESLVVLIERSTRESGLTKSLTGTDPSGPGGIQVRLDKAPFNAVIGWLARLSEQNGVRVEGATVDNAGVPGLVNAAIVLHTR